MATPKRSIESPHARRKTPYIFGRSLSLPGVKVGHVRMYPGEMSNNQLGIHHIYIPLDGSYEGTMVVGGGHIVHNERTVGQASIVPAGQQYRAVWKEEFEDVGIHLDPEFVSRQARELAQTDSIDLIGCCEIGD